MLWLMDWFIQPGMSWTRMQGPDALLALICDPWFKVTFVKRFKIWVMPKHVDHSCITLIRDKYSHSPEYKQATAHTATFVSLATAFDCVKYFLRVMIEKKDGSVHCKNPQLHCCVCAASKKPCSLNHWASPKVQTRQVYRVGALALRQGCHKLWGIGAGCIIDSPPQDMWLSDFKEDPISRHSSSPDWSRCAFGSRTRVREDTGLPCTYHQRPAGRWNFSRWSTNRFLMNDLTQLVPLSMSCCRLGITACALLFHIA